MLMLKTFVLSYIRGCIFLRGLRLCGLNSNLMILFYQTISESVIRYGIQAWYGNLSAQLKAEKSVLREAQKTHNTQSELRILALYA